MQLERLNLEPPEQNRLDPIFLDYAHHSTFYLYMAQVLCVNHLSLAHRREKKYWTVGMASVPGIVRPNNVCRRTAGWEPTITAESADHLMPIPRFLIRICTWKRKSSPVRAWTRGGVFDTNIQNDGRVGKGLSLVHMAADLVGYLYIYLPQVDIQGTKILPKKRFEAYLYIYCILQCLCWNLAA